MLLVMWFCLCLIFGSEKCGDFVSIISVSLTLFSFHWTIFLPWSCMVFFFGGYKSQDMTPSSEKAFNSGLVGCSAKNFVVTLPDLF